MVTKKLSLKLISLLPIILASLTNSYAFINQEEGELYKHPLFKRQRMQLVDSVVSEQKQNKKVTFAEVAFEPSSQTSLTNPIIKDSNHQRMDSVDCMNAIGQILLSGWRVNSTFITQVSDKVDEIDEKYAGTQKYLDAALRKAEIISQMACNYHKVIGLKLSHKKAPRRTILTGSIYRTS